MKRRASGSPGRDGDEAKDGSVSSASTSTPAPTAARKEKKPRFAVNMEEGSTGTLRRVAKFSDAFVTYYRDIVRLCADADEWKNFEETFLRELPTSFRVTAMGAHHKLVSKIFERNFLLDEAMQRLTLSATQAPTRTEDDKSELKRGEHAAESSLTVAAPKPIPWYLSGYNAFTYAIARNSLRRNAKLKQFKRFLAVEDEAGHVSGQELVSMIPSVVLDVQSHHLVLDMCAAPGSKSGQLLEKLQYGLEHNAIPSGVVVSNDVEVERAYMLTHRISRLGSPSMLVINYPAQHIPTMYSSGGGENRTPVLFDRVLADVPCSGDGTLRKAPFIASTWDNHGALNLHKIQIPIARRGVELLAVGGRMVYSTCSLNPIENEAVVAALLSEFRGALELVEAREMLTPLKCRNGLSTWPVWEPARGAVSSYESLDDGGKGLLFPTMFPPNPEVAKTLHLERCMRIHPHDNDTGGFFIAVLHKVRSTGREGKEVADAMISDEELEKLRQDETLKARMGYPRVFAETPFVPVPAELRRMLEETGAYFGMDGYDWSNLLTRGEAGKVVTLATPRLHDWLIRSANHTLFGDAGKGHSLKVIHGGVRVVQNDERKNKKLKDELGSHVRLAHEGLTYLAPFITKQCAVLDRATFEALLKLDGDVSLLLSKIENPAVRQAVESCAVGPAALIVDARSEIRANDPIDLVRYERTMTFPAWKGATSVRLNVSKTDLKSLRNLMLTDNYDYDLSA